MAGRERYAGNPKDGPGAAAFRVQSQIRRNAQDMQEYLAELGSWEKSIKKKDRCVRPAADSSLVLELGCLQADSCRVTVDTYLGTCTLFISDGWSQTVSDCGDSVT